MISRDKLKEVLDFYGIDSEKVVNNNANILKQGNYEDIDNVLNYLVNDLKIMAKNIEKCPSIMYRNVSAIKYNYLFLQNTNVKADSIETTLHILTTSPFKLQKTYKYIKDNYGIDSINKLTSILGVSVDRIMQIEKITNDKNVILLAAVSKLGVEDIKNNIEICQKYNIPIGNSVFLKKSDELEKIIKFCSLKKIPISGNVFLKSLKEIDKIVKICEEYKIPISGSVFMKSADDITRIIDVCIKENVPITGNVFLKKSQEIEKIIYVCKKYDIPVSGSVFMKSSKEVEDLIKLSLQENIPLMGNMFLRTAEEAKKIIAFCKENDIPINASVFKKNVYELESTLDLCQKYNLTVCSSMFLNTALENEKIILICLKNNIPITGSVFLKKALEVEKIIDLCHDNKIEISSSIFLKSAKNIEENILYVKSNYGEKFLKSLIINKSLQNLRTTLPYLDELNVLNVVLKSPSILTLSFDEVKNRIEYLKNNDLPIVVDNGRFNKVFGLSKKNYEKLISEKRTLYK